MSDAISKAIEKAHDDYRDTHGITGFARDALPLMAQAALQAMQGETYRFHCTNCGWKGDSLMAHKPACSALYMEHYPPQPAVPAAKVWNQAEGRDGKLYTDGWNACRDSMLSPAKGCAPRHQWDDGGERCVKCGDKDWFAGAVCDESKPLSAAKGEAVPTKTQISEAIFGWGLRNDDGNHLSMDDTDEIAEYIMAQALLSAAKGVTDEI
jgi:hypothetical protein